ncbi:MAG: diguanylate cyclase [Alphaproteobacteria bacterium]
MFHSIICTLYFILSLLLAVITLLLLKRLNRLNLKISDLTTENERMLLTPVQKQDNPLGTLLAPDTKSMALVVKKDGTIKEISNTLLELLGYTKKQLVGKNIYGTLMPALSVREPLEMNIITKIFQNPKLYTDYETELTTQSGQKVWISWTSRLMKNNKGEPVELRSVGFNITPRKKLEEELQFMASKDPQTKTLNRLSLLEVGTRELKRSIRYKHNFSVLALRLLSADKNLTAGQTEKLLQQVVSVCRQTIRDTDYMGRIGEAEFVLLLPETELKSIPFLQKRLDDKISEYNKKNAKLPILVSFGATTYTAKTKSIDDLISSAIANIKKRKTK